MSLEQLSILSVVVVALITTGGAILLKRTRDRDTEPEDALVTLVKSLPVEQQGFINTLLAERTVERTQHDAELLKRDEAHAAQLAARDGIHTAQLNEMNARIGTLESEISPYRDRIRELLHWGRYDPSPPPRVEPPGIVV